MRETARRIGDGQPLRDAMSRYGGGYGIGLEALSRATRDRDPDGRGVGRALIGFLTQRPRATGPDGKTTGSRHARDTCSVQTARLLEDTLGVPRGTLFDIVEAGSRSDPQPSWDDLPNVSAL